MGQLMLWFILGALMLVAIPVTEVLADWLRATRKLVAPWRDADPCENKPRKKVWFP